MEIANLIIQRLEFPGRAGELQRQQAVASLIRELGDNYEIYHDFLTKRFASLGGLPRAKSFATREQYIAACELAQDTVRAEAILRVCRNFRQRGGRLDAPFGSEHPLFDAEYRLLAAP